MTATVCDGLPGVRSTTAEDSADQCQHAVRLQDAGRGPCSRPRAAVEGQAATGVAADDHAPAVEARTAGPTTLRTRGRCQLTGEAPSDRLHSAAQDGARRLSGRPGRTPHNPKQSGQRQRNTPGVAQDDARRVGPLTTPKVAPHMGQASFMPMTHESGSSPRAALCPAQSPPQLLLE
jgi:hypothetical protein